MSKGLVQSDCEVPTDIHTLIEKLNVYIEDPKKGLPEEIFLFASSIVPMVNVDLLIKDAQGQTLLTWREDHYSKSGWHIPGGIIRHKETIAERIHKVALLELAANIEYDPIYLICKEFLIPERSERSHFISFLYQCTLLSALNSEAAYTRGTPVSGQWKWFDKAPDNLLSCHNVYREFL